MGASLPPPSPQPESAAPPDAPGEAPPPGRRRWPARRVALVVVLAMIAAAITSAAVVRVPYYAIAPGDARAAEQLVKVEGAQTHPSKGQVLYTTVRLRHESALRAVIDWIDKDTDVIDEKLILGTKSPSESRTENLRVMGESKETATYVALTKLGYPVTVTNGGVVVVSVADGVPAASVLKRNDVIVEADGKPVQIDSDLRAVVATKKPGDDLALEVTDPERTTTRDVTVRLAAREDGTALIGIDTGVPDTASFAYPITVDIDTGKVGGPSAGLAFTLAVLDVLTPGDITGGKKVAVTGTIDANGRVGQIGGIRQKTVAVKGAGADVFIVPADEADVAEREAAGSKLKVVGVRTLDDALDALASLGGNANDLGTPGKAA